MWRLWHIQSNANLHINLEEKEHERNPTTANWSKREGGEEDGGSMVRDGGEGGDGGNCVEDQVVDGHAKLQASAPLPPDVSPHCDGERLAYNTLYQLANSHPGKEVLAEKKRG